MTYLVCKHKDDGKLFITTRRAREISISVLNDLGQIIESRVLAAFDTFDKANRFKEGQDNSDDLINSIIKE